MFVVWCSLIRHGTGSNQTNDAACVWVRNFQLVGAEATKRLSWWLLKRSCYVNIKTQALTISEILLGFKACMCEGCEREEWLNSDRFAGVLGTGQQILSAQVETKFVH